MNNLVKSIFNGHRLNLEAGIDIPLSLQCEMFQLLKMPQYF